MKTLSRVIKNLLDLDEKKIASWNAHHSKVYYQLLGKRHSVGIEIESSTPLSLNQLNKLENEGFVVSWLMFHFPKGGRVTRLTSYDIRSENFLMDLNGFKWASSSKVQSLFKQACCKSFEVTYLFDVSDPLKFIKDLKRIWTNLLSIKAKTNSFHINVQMKLMRQSYFKRIEDDKKKRTFRKVTCTIPIRGNSNTYTLGNRRTINPKIENRSDRYVVDEFKTVSPCLLVNSLLCSIIILSNNIQNYLASNKPNWWYETTSEYDMTDKYRSILSNKLELIMKLCDEQFPDNLRFLHYKHHSI